MSKVNLITILIITSPVIQQCFSSQAVPRGSTFIINIIDNESRNHICIGSYIRRYWVLTNAVCAQSVQSTNEPLLIASDVIDDDDGQKRKPMSFSLHPEYDAKKMTNNIALIEISFPFTPGRDVDLIGYTTTVKRMGSCNLVGWIFDNRKDDYHQYVMVMSVKTKRLEAENCVEMAEGKEISYIFNNEEMLCVWDALCMSEEGAPLVCDGKLFGVLSYTTCSYTVVERVKYHTAWIDMVTAKITKRDAPIPATRSSRSDPSPILSYAGIAFLTFILCVVYLLRVIK
ncbi:hypothetical protein Trydic_g13606 [Trypoxylus dichotomus]